MSEKNLKISLIKEGLARHLLWVMLLIVLVPVLLISGLSYKIASDDLYKESVKGLTSAAILQNSQMSRYVDRIELDLLIESERLSNVSLLIKLSDAFKKSGLGLKDFVTSFQWAMITDSLDVDIKRFGEAFDYYDIFLIDSGGNVLFTLAHEDDFGTNIFDGKYAKTKFAQAARQSYKTGKVTFSDFERYAPSDNEIASFFVNVVLDEYGDKVGLIAFKPKFEKIEEIMQVKVKNALLATYLLGTDLIIRTNPIGDAQNLALNKKINSASINTWLVNHSSDNNETAEVINFNGSNDQQDIAVLQSINIADKRFIIVAEESLDDLYAGRDQLAQSVILLMALIILLVFIVVIRVTRGLVSPIIRIEQALAKITVGDYDQSFDVNAAYEVKSLANGLDSMQRSLRENQQKTNLEDWYQEGTAKLNKVIQGEQSVAVLSREIIRFVCEYFDASIGAFYVVSDDGVIRLMGSYAFLQRKTFVNTFATGEGMVGQAVLEQQALIIHDVPDDYIAISSGLGHSAPKCISVIPIVWNGSVRAVIEVGSHKVLDDNQRSLLDLLGSAISTSLTSSISRDQTNELLVQTQTQAEELKAREEELRENNDVLKDQSSSLEQAASELEEKNHALQTQQEELKASNEELEIKTQELQRSGAVLEEKNADLDAAQIALEKKANDLAASSKYKSEFLANMSHELRTPLNSLLILSKLLSDNKKNNLDEKQIEYAATIYDSGTDLLNLINDILDLSKIEAGRMDVHIEKVLFAELCSSLERKFKPLTDKKGIALDVVNQLNDESILTDGHKLEQVVKNLMSNAIKFTSKGSVVLTFSALSDVVAKQKNVLASDFIQVSVKDSGIGLKEDTLQSIFEAFQQADGTTSRKFGGTGLGLSISRVLSHLLGGDIFVSSVLGEGSEFSVIVKRVLGQQENAEEIQSNNMDVQASLSVSVMNKEVINDITEKQPLDVTQTLVNEDITDDRHDIKPGDRSLLIIEDDRCFAKILSDVGREKGFKVLIASDGETGLYFADYYKPSAIILDIGLPGIDGWKVMDRLKANLDTRHIPVHFMSGNEKTKEVFKLGALGYLQKPISMEQIDATLSHIQTFINEPTRKLLVIEDNKVQRDSMIELIGEGDVDTDSAESAEQALNLLKDNHYGCIVLDLGLPDMDGVELLKRIREDMGINETPVIVYSGKELNRSEKEELDQYASSIIIKNTRSPEMLLDETSLFLHRIQQEMPKERQNMLRMMHDHASVLEGRKILVVDDDMRNVFALTTMLRDRDMIVTTAKNGLDALEKLEKMDVPDMVLMDIMMPEMDGYEAMQKIRAQEKYADLSIIALTAKAMKGDRSKCIESGANDYLSKPIDTDKLLSMMRVWLYR